MRHHGPRTDALFERLVRVWTAQGAGRGWGLEDHVRKARSPVLAIQGAEDEFFSEAQLHALGGLLPQLRTLRLAGCGHYPQHQARDETLAAAIGFIRATLAASLDAEGAAA